MKLSNSMKAALLSDLSDWEAFYSGTSLRPSGIELSSHAALSQLLQVLLLRRSGETWDSIAIELEQAEGFAKNLVDSFEDLDLGRIILDGEGISFAEVCEIIDWVFHEEDDWDFVAEDSFTADEDPPCNYQECLEQDTWSVVEICAAIQQEYPGVNLNHFIKDLPAWITGEYVPRSRSKRQVDDLEIRESYIAALKLAASYHYPLSSNAFDSLVKLGAVAAPGKQTISKYFGSWTAACFEAGIDPVRSGFRTYARTWSDTEMIDFVCDCKTAISNFPTVAQYDAWARLNDGAPSASTLRVRLGSWGEINLLVNERLREKKA